MVNGIVAPADPERATERIKQLQALHENSFNFVLLAILINLLALASLALTRRLGTLALVPFLGLEIVAMVLMYRGLSAACAAKGQPAGFALAAMVLSLLGTGVLGLLLVALLPDHNRALRESLFSGQRLFRPALYSIIIGIPMP